MNINYKYAESTIKPNVVEICKDRVYLRKDFSTRVQAMGIDIDIDGDNNTDSADSTNATTFYTYNEAELSLDDFNQYISTLLVENETNMTTIMEAIADLYTTVVSLQS